MLNKEQHSDDLASTLSKRPDQSTTGGTQMTDIEMTKLCAEAMGFTEWVNPNEGKYRDELCWRIPDDVQALGKHELPRDRCPQWHWNPLAYDSQAMALVKRFALRLHFNPMLRTWVAAWLDEHQVARYEGWGRDNLNRAIVECVAKMRATNATASVNDAESIETK